MSKKGKNVFNQMQTKPFYKDNLNYYLKKAHPTPSGITDGNTLYF